MYTITIIEDDKQIREYVKIIVSRTLKSLNVDYDIVTFASAEEFIGRNIQQPIHLLLLDIELPEMNGIELAQQLAQNTSETPIIFLTSFEGYMSDAFGINVHRYILKDELERRLPNELTTLVNTHINQRFIRFKVPDTTIRIEANRILYIEQLGRNPYLYLIDGERIKLSTSTLKSVFSELSDKRFLRINNHIIVNMNHIYSFSSTKVKLHQISRYFEISRRNRNFIIEQYETYLIEGSIL